MAGKVVVIEVGQDARVVDHPGDRMELADLYRYTGCDCVDTRTMGPIPGSSRICDIWFDDNGLLKKDSVPNRKIGPNTIIVGTIALCAREGDENYPFTDAEAETVRAFVEERWPKLPPDHPKPDPTWEFISIPRPPRT